MYILDPDLSEEEVSGLKERFSQLAQSQGAEVSKVVRWERRRLAYPIRQKREGTYIIMELRAQPPAVQEVTRQLKLSERVLRHMVLRLEEARPAEEKPREEEGEGK